MAAVAHAPTTHTVNADRSNYAQHNLLSFKIAQALKHAGYTFADEQKVTNLVLSYSLEFALPNVLTDVDSRFLDAAQGLQPSNFNSNEPVLLISLTERNDALQNEVIDVLRSRGVKPVRIYVRLSETNTALLLNVVNTDIGGPSMVQLLDAAFHTQWSELVVKEAWNGWDLLWRDEAWPKPEQIEPEVEVPEAAGEAETEVKVEPVSGTSREADVAGHAAPDENETAKGLESRTVADIETVPVDLEETAVDLAQHPAYVELQRRESERQHTAHPSWDRDDNGLLDVIESQSAGIGVIEAKIDDDFELVEHK